MLSLYPLHGLCGLCCAATQGERRMKWWGWIGVSILLGFFITLTVLSWQSMLAALGMTVLLVGAMLLIESAWQ